MPSNDPIMLTNVKKIMNNLVQKYHSIFEDDNNCTACDDDIDEKSNTSTSETCIRRQVLQNNFFIYFNVFSYVQDCQLL